MTNLKSIGQVLNNLKDSIAEKAVNVHYNLYPELIDKHGSFGKEKFLEDTKYHLSYLAEALTNSSPELFVDYILWANYVLESRNVPKKDLIDSLKILEDVIKESISEEIYSVIHNYIDISLNKLKSSEHVLPSFIINEEPYSELASKYLGALLQGKKYFASQLILDAVENDQISIKDIYIHVFQKSQHEIGRLWQLNKINVAQEHYATAATQVIMSQLYQYVFSSDRKDHTLVATSISEDLHEIGIRMVADFFEIEGWNTFYLGANTPINNIIQMLIANKADVLAVSVTISYHIKILEELIRKVRAEEKCKDVKIIVGGYPFNISPELWKKVGADGYASNAEDAVAKANELVKI